MNFTFAMKTKMLQSLLVLTFLILQSGTSYPALYFNDGYQTEPSIATSLQYEEQSNIQNILQTNKPNKYNDSPFSWFPNKQNELKSDSVASISMYPPHSKEAPFIYPPTHSQKPPFEFPQDSQKSFLEYPPFPQHYSTLNSLLPLSMSPKYSSLFPLASSVYPPYPQDVVPFQSPNILQIPLVYALYSQKLPVVPPYQMISPMTLSLDLMTNNFLTMATIQNLWMSSSYLQFLANNSIKTTPAISHLSQPTSNKFLNGFSSVESQKFSPLISFNEYYLQDQPLKNSTNSVFPEKADIKIDFYFKKPHFPVNDEKKSEINTDYVINNIQKENTLNTLEPTEILDHIKLNADVKKEESLKVPNYMELEENIKIQDIVNKLEPQKVSNNLKSDENMIGDEPKVLKDDQKLFNPTQITNDINSADMIKNEIEDVKKEMKPSNTSNIVKSAEDLQNDTHEIIEEDVTEEDFEENEIDNDYLLKKELQELYSNYGKPLTN
ncbi:uncharacterized protein LOC126902242 [Daktulosphaira vitifoliae]|uniref:uncharacterized protein LOC126902242 n=1 Tax=Daktulosphaira vitifoliae TaxID=58002 RepID=UPI0021AA66A7|nr:uncharacterized protein LOC126902242 [Daktulosphaira vitifoliae]